MHSRDMSFPTDDTARAFEHFVHAQLVREQLCKARPHLAPQIRFSELHPMVWVLLPGNQRIIYSRTKYRGIVGWAIVTPDSADDVSLDEFFFFGTDDEVVAEMLTEYDRFIAAISSTRFTPGHHRANRGFAGL